MSEHICAVGQGSDHSFFVKPLFGKPFGKLPLPETSLDIRSGDILRIKRDRNSVEILERSAHAGSALAALYGVAKRFDLDPVYSPEVLREAQELVENPGLDDPELKDLTHLPFVTIDGESARDLDQALYFSKTEDGGYCIYYALADAAHYIRPGSALFEHGLATGASFYMPGLVIPMLPRILSENLISLNPGVVRRAFLFEMFLDSEAHCVRTELSQARIQSVAKLSYNAVQDLYDRGSQSPLADQPYADSLELLRTVGKLRILEQQSRDVVQIQRSYVEVKLSDDEGLTFEATSGSRINVERYNEQISLLCNIEGARVLAQGHPEVQPVFRAHPAPRSGRIVNLETLVDAMVKSRNLPDLWRWKHDATPREPLAEYLQRLPRDPETDRIRRAIERQAIVVNQRSIYQEEPALHFGIGAPFYARFSSPMRELVGIYTHKEALEMLGRADAFDPKDDLELREKVIEAGNRARNIQRRITKESNKLVLDHIFNSDLDRPVQERPWRIASVMGLSPTRVYLQLDDPPVEVKLYSSDLENVYQSPYALSENDVEMLPQQPNSEAPDIRIGDALSIRVEGYHQDERRWFFKVTCEDHPVVL